MITFNFPIEPVAKGRPRIWNGRAVTPPKTREFEKTVKALARSQYKGEPLDGPLRMVVVFMLKKPKTVKREYPTVKPDLSNLVKSLEDALNGIAYVDDSLIIETLSSKKYGPVSGVFVDVSPYLEKTF